MTEAQAHALIAQLMAAFPQQRVEAPTVAVYSQHLARLEDANTALVAVLALIENAEWFPTIAAIRGAYDAELRRTRMGQPSLKEPAMSNADRAENLRRAYELLHRIGKPIPEVPS